MVFITYLISEVTCTEIMQWVLLALVASICLGLNPGIFDGLISFTKSSLTRSNLGTKQKVTAMFGNSLCGMSIYCVCICLKCSK